MDIKGVPDKVWTGVFVVIMVAISGWGVTYVPVISDTLPSLMVAPTPTVHLDYSEFTVGDLESGTMSEGFVQDACKKIPFMLRPLASKPSSARVVFTMDGTTVGDAVFSCRDGHVIEMNRT